MSFQERMLPKIFEVANKYEDCVEVGFTRQGPLTANSGGYVTFRFKNNKKGINYLMDCQEILDLEVLLNSENGLEAGDDGYFLVYAFIMEQDPESIVIYKKGVDF